MVVSRFSFKALHNRTRGLLPWALLLSLAVRSLVAPGYEFANINKNGRFSLGVVWCPGLNNIYSLDEDHGDHDHEQPADKTDGDHFTATCGLWSGNTSFVNNTIPFNQTLLMLHKGYVPAEYNPLAAIVTNHRIHPPRAPPL